MENFGVYFFVGLILFVGLFLLLREVMCWYYKINERISVQQETNKLLGRLLNDMPQPTTYAAPVSVPPIQNLKKVFCTECGKQHIDSSKYNCICCGAVIN